MHKQKFLAISITLVMLLSLMGPSFSVSARPLAQSAPPLGVLQSYSVLAHTGVTNSGPTSMPGNVGSDTSSIGGGITFTGPGTQQTTAQALVAQNAAITAKNSLESQGPGTTVVNELAGTTLTHGVYTVPGVSLLSSNVLGGVLTLDGPGVYIFLTSGLVASGTVRLINGADACNVFWRDASSVSINNSGTGGSFIGTIIALTAITFNAGAKLEGRAIAQNANVTLLSNTITGPTCATTPTTKLLNSDESPVSSNTPANTVTAGSIVHDSVTIAGANSITLTGTVTYNIYSDSTCQTPATGVTGGNTDTQTIAANGVVPNSKPFTFPNVGDYYFQATYSGDAFNLASTSACNEPLFVISTSPTPIATTLTTLLSASTLPVGPTPAIVTDTATLNKGAGIPVPTGKVTYSYYTDNLCQLGYKDAGTVTLSGGTVPPSTPITFATAGTYYWQAIYTGDTNYIGSVSACTPANNELLTITKLSPTITTRLSSGLILAGGAVFDTATLVGATSDAVGTVTYFVYTNPTCTSLNPQVAGIVQVTSGTVPPSSSITFNTPGIYYWQAVYIGGPNNNNATSPCTLGNDEMLLVGNVRPPGPVPTGVPTPAPTSAPSSPSSPKLPGTGFAANRVTTLAQQSTSYSKLGDLWLEIPRLGVQMAIVGVPQQADGEWDVSWLGNDAGWLNGTAFPTHAGNAVLTGHVYDADGNPGPFVHLNGLWWGDQVIVHAYGTQYVYEVRSVLQVTPGSVSSVIKHQTLPWVTLLTCRGYDEASNSYKYRVAVGAVLVAVK